MIAQPIDLLFEICELNMCGLLPNQLRFQFNGADCYQ